MVAGLLMLTAGIINILWLAAAFTRIIDIKALLRGTWVISPFPYINLDIGFGGNIVLTSIIVVVFIAEILLSLISSIFALRKRMWGLALTGSVSTLICVPLLGIVAIILTVISKRSFSRPQV